MKKCSSVVLLPVWFNLVQHQQSVEYNPKVMHNRAGGKSEAWGTFR
jgi:hypothetical protein